MTINNVKIIMDFVFGFDYADKNLLSKAVDLVNTLRKTRSNCYGLVLPDFFLFL